MMEPQGWARGPRGSLAPTSPHPIPRWGDVGLGAWGRSLPRPLCWQGWGRWLGGVSVGWGGVRRCWGLSPAAVALHQAPEQNLGAGVKGGLQPRQVQPRVLPWPPSPSEARLRGCPLPGDTVTPGAHPAAPARTRPCWAGGTLPAAGSVPGPQREQSRVWSA